MKMFLFVLFFFTCGNSNEMSRNPSTYYYLALGDSYTIGESVPASENFPNQVAAMLSPWLNLDTRIIAKTGWTTDELAEGIRKEGIINGFRDHYDFVSLLIGVNNQYRGRDMEEYRQEFKLLLQQAIRFSGNKTNHVVVLSIPDWGVTPYAEGRDREKIAREINEYNETAKAVCLENNIAFIDITAWTREAAGDLSLLTTDGLHPSGKEYKRWAKIVADYFRSVVNSQ